MNLVLRPIAVEDVDALQDLIESDPGYTERVTGYPPGPADAQSLLMMRPDGLAEDAKVATAFWLRQGFEPTGEERPYRYDKLETTARLYEKQLTPSTRSRSATTNTLC